MLRHRQGNSPPGFHTAGKDETWSRERRHGSFLHLSGPVILAPTSLTFPPFNLTFLILLLHCYCAVTVAVLLRVTVLLLKDLLFVWSYPSCQLRFPPRCWSVLLLYLIAYSWKTRRRFISPP